MKSGELLDSKAALTGVSTLVPCWSPEWIWWSLYDGEEKKEPPDQMRSQPGASWASGNPPMFCSFVPEECNNKLQHISGLRRVWLPPLRAFVLLLIFQFRGCNSNHISLPERLSIMSDAAIYAFQKCARVQGWTWLTNSSAEEDILLTIIVTKYVNRGNTYKTQVCEHWQFPINKTLWIIWQSSCQIHLQHWVLFQL